MNFLYPIVCSILASFVSHIVIGYLNSYKKDHQLSWGSIVNGSIRIAIMVTLFYAYNTRWSKNIHLLLAFLLAFTYWIPFVLSKKPITRLDILVDIVCPIVTIILADIGITVKASANP